MKKPNVCAGLLLCAILLSAAACGDAGTTAPEETEPVSTAAVTEAETEEPFVYEFTDAYAGTEFRVINAGDIYSMHGEINRTEEIGEQLNDAMYRRCRTFEEKTGTTFVETLFQVDYDLVGKEQKAIMAGDDVYDIMYVPARELYQFLEEGYLYDLTTLDGIMLDKPWWYSSYNDVCTIGGHLYAAAGAAQLMVFDSLWCIYFNENMMQSLDLEYPYQLVRDGKWTMDAMKEYMTKSMNLNGDDRWDANGGGNCIYGLSGTTVPYFMYGSGEFAIGSKNGKLEYTAGSEHFFNSISKIKGMLKDADGMAFTTVSGVVDGLPGNYITMFEDQRSLFLTAEISKTNRMREFTWSFGIVPYPKYDEAQKDYYAVPFYATPGFAIPVTVADPERSAVLGDILNYLSEDMVVPVFKEVTLAQKGLRNEDSIEMLGIIMNSITPRLDMIFHIGNSMFDEISELVESGSDAAASIVAANESMMKAEIEEANNAAK